MLERVQALVLDLKLQRIGERCRIVQHSHGGNVDGRHGAGVGGKGAVKKRGETEKEKAFSVAVDVDFSMLSPFLRRRSPSFEWQEEAKSVRPPLRETVARSPRPLPPPATRPSRGASGGGGREAVGGEEEKSWREGGSPFSLVREEGEKKESVLRRKNSRWQEKRKRRAFGEW